MIMQDIKWIERSLQEWLTSSCPFSYHRELRRKFCDYLHSWSKICSSSNWFCPTFLDKTKTWRLWSAYSHHFTLMWQRQCFQHGEKSVNIRGPSILMWDITLWDTILKRVTFSCNIVELYRRSNCWHIDQSYKQRSVWEE